MTPARTEFQRGAFVLFGWALIFGRTLGTLPSD
jgi:hypothetical protein